MTLDLMRQACLSGGNWISSSTWIDVDNPSTGAIIGRVPSLGSEETRRAIDLAAEAMVPWAATSAADRAVIVQRIGALMIEHSEQLAGILTLEQGKPLAEARGEIAYAASYFTWFAEEAKRVYGDIVPADHSAARTLVMKQPVGVVGAITPWNFPSAMVARKLAPAIAAGCAIIVKPAAQTPFSALAIGVLAQEAGLPAGVLGIITGSAAEIGGELTANPLVRKLSFTGSTGVGKKLYGQCADTLKRMSLELGGNAPLIVFDDADLATAVRGAMDAKFRNAGQTCVCANRILVEEGIHDAFVEALAREIAGLSVGDGFACGTQIGPLIDSAAVAKVDEHVTDAVAKGARLVSGGRSSRSGPRFYEPTLLCNVDSTMLVASEETFGPIAPVFRFRGEAEAVRLANATEYGLAAYVFTNDLSRAWRISEALEVGMVGLNSGKISSASAPFGGIKMSGMGREGSHYGIEEYLSVKTVHLALAGPAT